MNPITVSRFTSNDTVQAITVYGIPWFRGKDVANKYLSMLTLAKLLQIVYVKMVIKKN